MQDHTGLHTEECLSPDSADSILQTKSAYKLCPTHTTSRWSTQENPTRLNQQDHWRTGWKANPMSAQSNSDQQSSSITSSVTPVKINNHTIRQHFSAFLNHSNSSHHQQQKCHQRMHSSFLRVHPVQTSYHKLQLQMKGLFRGHQPQTERHLVALSLNVENVQTNKVYL